MAAETAYAKCTCVIHPSGSPNVSGYIVAVQSQECSPFVIQVRDKKVAYSTTFRQHPIDAVRGIVSIIVESTVAVSDASPHDPRLAPEHVQPRPQPHVQTQPLPGRALLPPASEMPRPDNVARRVSPRGVSPRSTAPHSTAPHSTAPHSNMTKNYKPTTPVLLKTCLETVRHLVAEAEYWAEEERQICTEIDEKLKLLEDDEHQAEEMCNSALAMVDQACSRRAEREKTYEKIVEILDKM
jgi:hypothetical protein